GWLYARQNGKLAKVSLVIWLTKRAQKFQNGFPVFLLRFLSTWENLCRWDSIDIGMTVEERRPTACALYPEQDDSQLRETRAIVS
ncbi:hypothetical protein BaRGS_00010410, partial [Batillaria attramentaria]